MICNMSININTLLLIYMTNITDTIAISSADVFIIVDLFLLSYFRVIITYHYSYVKFFIIYNILLVNTYIHTY